MSLNKIDWESVKAEYLKQKFTKAQLCEIFDIKLSQLNYRIKKYNWDAEKEKIKRNIFKPEGKKQEVDYNQEHLKMYEDCARIIRALTQLYLNSDIEPDAGALQKIVIAIEKIQKGQRVSLGLDKETAENSLPTVNIVENLDKDKL